MKRCPTCNRTYSDETITFCLEDGALLSAPYIRPEPPPTERMSAEQLKETRAASASAPEVKKRKKPTKSIRANTQPRQESNSATTGSKAKSNRYVPFIIIALVLIAGITAIVIFSRQRGDNGGAFATNNQPAETASSSTTPQSSPNAPAGLTKPNVKVSSPVVLEEYGDYQCPPCGMLHPVLKAIEHEYGDQLRVVFRHFPLTKIHKNAMMAAQAAEAARNQGKFWEMHDQLYRNQNAWKDLADGRPTFIGYARELGLNVERFSREMDSSEVQQRITSDMQKGSGAGVTGTPTVFIEGQMLRYEATTPDGLRKGINFMLQRKAGGQ